MAFWSGFCLRRRFGRAANAPSHLKKKLKYDMICNGSNNLTALASWRDWQILAIVSIAYGYRIQVSGEKDGNKAYRIKKDGAAV